MKVAHKRLKKIYIYLMSHEKCKIDVLYYSKYMSRKQICINATACVCLLPDVCHLSHWFLLIKYKINK